MTRKYFFEMIHMFNFPFFYIIILLILPLSSISCATIAERGKIIDGEYIPEEYMKIKGLGSKKADFEKGKIENDTGFRIPDINIDDLKTN